MTAKGALGDGETILHPDCRNGYIMVTHIKIHRILYPKRINFAV